MKQRFRTTLIIDGRGRLYLPVPFDPDAAWGARPRHHVRGHIGPIRFRGALQTFDGGEPQSSWGFRLNPKSQAACELSAGDAVDVEMWPEGPQTDDLSPDIMIALAAEPEAQAFFQGLATFYRKGWLRWIDATTRRPDERARRIADMIQRLKAGEKERARPERS
jgi:hypothetical protein